MKKTEHPVGGRTQKLLESFGIASTSKPSKINWKMILRTTRALLLIGAAIYFWRYGDEFLSGFDQDWLPFLIIVAIGITGLYLDSRPPKK